MSFRWAFPFFKRAFGESLTVTEEVAGTDAVVDTSCGFGFASVAGVEVSAGDAVVAAVFWEAVTGGTVAGVVFFGSGVGGAVEAVTVSVGVDDDEEEEEEDLISDTSFFTSLEETLTESSTISDALAVVLGLPAPVVSFF